jgi:cell division protein FtsB
VRLPFSNPKHKIPLLLAITLIALLAANVIWGPYGLLHLRFLEGQQAQLEAQLFRLHQQNEWQRRHLQRLEQDDHYLEQVIRQRLGFVGPNEVLVVFATPTPTAAASP